MAAVAPTSIAVLDEKLDSSMYEKLNLKDVLNKQHAATGRRMSLAMYSNESRKAFLQGLKDMHKGAKFVDCLVSTAEVVVSAKEYPAHKVILGAHSTVLTKMIEEAEANEQIKDGKTVIVVDGVQPAVLDLMLNYVYSGEVTLSDESVVDVFTVANRFDIEDLQRLCEEHVGKHISVDTVIPFMLDANMHKATRLKEKCQDFLKEHLKELIAAHSEQVMHLPKPVLIDILKVDLSRIEETEIFKLVKKWGETRQALIKEKFPTVSAPPLKDLLSGLIECIRFVSLPKKFIQKEVLPLGVVSEEMMIQILFHKAKDPVYLSYDSTANAGEAQESAAASDNEVLPLYLRPRGNQWKTMADFPSEEAYAAYMKGVLKPGMRLRAVRTYENVMEGDTGEFVQWNAGFPPCQVRWTGYGSTYWLHWRDIVICEN